ncbi:MAG: hypothetical protein AMK71_00170 [Nitrospira bacterium SG8_35_4]|nr:MAG: hypothetical protein AMK71_00170 [Nitrospira bacterium SG8_35_4]
MKTIITFVIIAGLAAVAGSIIVGVKTFDGTVTANPYEKGLLWDDVQNRVNELGWSIEVRNDHFSLGKNDLIISVLDKAGRPLAGSAVSVTTGRAATSEYDRHVDTVPLNEGTFGAPVAFQLYGYWDITIEVSQNGDTLSFTKKVFVEQGG